MTTFSHSAGGVVLDAQGNVLVVQQRDGSWSLPKGGINEGEDPRDAARREIMEESGIRHLIFIKILKSYSRYAMANTGMEDQGKLKRITMYLFTTNETETHPMDPRVEQAKWVPKEEIGTLLTNPKDEEFFESILTELHIPVGVAQ